jgi:hypothetical protein
VLIAFVILVNWLDGMPIPILKARDLRYAVAREELALWSGFFGAMGLSLSPDELAELALNTSATISGTKRSLMAPWQPVKALTGTGQSWGLFAYPDPHAGRLIVRAHSGDEQWQTLFSAPEGEGELAELLRYRRVRGVWDDAGDRPHPSPLYDRFATEVARRAFAADPSLVELEVRIDLIHIQLPGQTGEARPEDRRHLRLRTRSQVEQGWAD